MDFIVIGDMHLGKKLLNITPNPFFNFLDLPRVYSIWSEGILRHIKENLVSIVHSKINSDSIIRWVFLGDIFDYPKVGMIEEFRDVLDYILDQNNKWSIDILVGNHDISKVGDPTKTVHTTSR